MTNRRNKQDKANNYFANVRVLTEAQLWELIDKKEFAWNQHLDKTPLHLLEERKVLEQLSNQSLSIYPPHLLKRLSNKCKSNDKNKDLFTKLLTNNHASFAMREMPAKRRGDLDFVLNILQIYKDRKESLGNIYDDLTPRLKNLKKVALLAFECGADPRDLPGKFLADIDIFKAYIGYQNQAAKKYNKESRYYHLPKFKLKKMNLDIDFITKLLQRSPQHYEHLSINHKTCNKLAWIALKYDVKSYMHFSPKLQENLAIINYVGVRDPSLLVKNLSLGVLIKINYSKLDLSKKARKYIFNKLKRTLQNRNADLLEIAALKANIFNFPTVNSNAPSCNDWHFSKAQVLKAIDNIPANFGYGFPFHRLLSNISYDLKYDLDILCQLALKGRFTTSSYKSQLNPSPKLIRQINKYLFVKGRYEAVTLPAKGVLRDYMLSRICNSKECNKLQAIRNHLTLDEKVMCVRKNPKIIKSFYMEDVIKIKRYLGKRELKTLINDKDFLRTYPNHHLYSLFPKSYKQNLKLGVRWLLDWPCKESINNISINYLLKNKSFLACLKHIKEITIHSGDLKTLPAPLRNNKLFIKKALNFRLNLFREIGTSLQIDPEITDWVFAIRPDLAEFLSESQFQKLDTTNLHPSTRKIIYQKYLAKYQAGDVLEAALMKQQLLKLNNTTQHAA